MYLIQINELQVNAAHLKPLDRKDMTPKVGVKWNSVATDRKNLQSRDRSLKTLFKQVGIINKYGRPGLVVTHLVSRFLYFLHSIFRKVVICQSFE